MEVRLYTQFHFALLTPGSYGKLLSNNELVDLLVCSAICN
jgi:hypothetical protein